MNAFTAALAAATLLTGLSASPATAGTTTPGCATKAEYRSIHDGMTKKRVHATLGTRGLLFHKQTIPPDGPLHYARIYDVCRSPMWLIVAYTENRPAPDRVVNKVVVMVRSHW